MRNERPVYVYHEGSWRRYAWSRDLLQLTSLGDVIPGLDRDEAEDPASLYVFTDEQSPADILAVDPPSKTHWEQLQALAKG